MSKNEDSRIGLLTQLLYGLKKKQNGFSEKAIDENKKEAAERLRFLSMVAGLLKEYGLDFSNIAVDFNTKTISINAGLDVSTQLEIIERLSKAITLK